MSKKVISQLTLSFSLLFLSHCSNYETSNNSDSVHEMQQLVINIAHYTRQSNPNFIVIPQNGAELAFTDADSEQGFYDDYLTNIDGFGIEELYYNGSFSPDFERISMLKELSKTKKVLVSEYINSNSLLNDARQANSDEGFVSFIRTPLNYDYKEIPSTIQQENSNDITQLSEVQNYLYLISTENYSSKKAFISAISETNYDLILIDLFFDSEIFSLQEINQLKTKKNGGKRLVICYVSIGSAEKYRYYWNSSWKLKQPNWLAKPYDGYPDEFWVNYWDKDWQAILFGNDSSYFKKILSAGFDGAYLDNVEAYYFLYHD
jgi:cysteinyl-tRNA synthetase, unknown class